MSPVFDDSFMHVVIRLHVNIPMTQRRVRTKTIYCSSVPISQWVAISMMENECGINKSVFVF